MTKLSGVLSSVLSLVFKSFKATLCSNATVDHMGAAYHKKVHMSASVKTDLYFYVIATP